MKPGIRKLLDAVFFAGVFVAAVSLFNLAAVQARSGEDNVTSNEADNFTRACSPAIGDSAITITATAGASAPSGLLTNRTIYLLRCDTDAWVRFGNVAQTAAVDDWRVDAGEVHIIRTGGTQPLRHMAALNVTSDGDCRMIECF